jgi:hypothetical protein
MQQFIKRGFITGCLATTILITGVNAPAYSANDAILSALNINGTENSFEITLKTNKDINVKTKVPSQDRLIVELDNTKAAELIQTTFKNARAIDDVIVQPVGKSKTRLYISGAGISKSKIIIDSTKTPVIEDKYAQEKSYSLINSAKQTQIEEKIANQKTMTAEEFIESNTEPLEETQNVIATTPETKDLTTETDTETTGIISEPPAVEEALEATQEPTEISVDQESVETDFFKPAAVLELPENNTATTTVKKSQESAAAATAKNFSDSGLQTASTVEPNWLLRFGLIFVFVTLLVAYLRKEKLLSFGNKTRSRQNVLNKEHLDIYRSLRNSTQASAPYNKKPSRTRITTMDKTKGRTNKAYGNKSQKQTTSGAKKLSQHVALTGYNNQNKAYKNRILSQNSAPRSASGQATAQARKTASLNKQISTDSVDFLRKMAEMYKQSGRHDLAMNIQKKLRQAEAKA